MAGKTHLAPHLTVDELEARYKAASSAADARRFHALWLIAQGHTAVAAAALVGLRWRWVSVLVQRYNQHGPDGLQDRRHANPGQPPLLSAEHLLALDAALQTAPADGGQWSGPHVAAWVQQHLAITISSHVGWLYLRRLGYTLQQPRPQSAQAANPQEQQRWKKNSTTP